MAANFGLDTSITLRTVALEMPDGSTVAVYALQPDIRMSTSTGRQHLGEALVCRLQTARATLPDVVIPSTLADYGFLVDDALNSDLSAREVAMFASDADGECEKDPRVIKATSTPVFAGSVLMVPIVVTDSVGPFSLVLAVSEVNTTILAAPR